MKALCLFEPWASLVVYGFKRFETRPRGISWRRYRGQLAIHASKDASDIEEVYRLWHAARPSQPLPEVLEPWHMRLNLGCVLGTVDMVDDHLIDSDGHMSRYEHGGAMLWCRSQNPVTRMYAYGLSVPADQLPLGDFSPGRRVIELARPRAFVGPVPTRGRQGIWNLPDDVAGQVMNA